MGNCYYTIHNVIPLWKGNICSRIIRFGKIYDFLDMTDLFTTVEDCWRHHYACSTEETFLYDFCSNSEVFASELPERILNVDVESWTNHCMCSLWSLSERNIYPQRVNDRWIITISHMMRNNILVVKTIVPNKFIY